MLKKRECVRSPAFVPSGPSDENTVDFTGSSEKPTPLLTKELIVVQRSPVFCCFLLYRFFLSPVHLPSCPARNVHCLLLLPQGLSVNNRYGGTLCQPQPRRAVSGSSLISTLYTRTLTIIFLADWQHVFSLAEQYHQAAAKNYRLWNLSVLFPLLVVRICWSWVPFQICKLCSPGILQLTLL